MESCIPDCEDCDRNCDRSRAWYFSATGDWYWSDRNDVCAGIESNCTNLVFVLVISSIANAGKGNGKQFRMITFMYILSTMLAAVVAVSASFLFPVTMTLDIESYQSEVVPSGIVEVLQNILMNITDNPLRAMLDANYICILAWAVLFGLAMRSAGKGVKASLDSISDAVSRVVRWIIGCAPFGIMGLVFTTVSESGLSIFKEYGKLLLVLVGAMLTVALIVDPLLASLFLKKNAYPLAFVVCGSPV